MNYLIVGAGSIGCYVGARLTAAGKRVALVGRQHMITPLASNGLTVSDLDGFQAHLTPSQLTICTSVKEGWQTLQSTNAKGEPTVILLCVKGGATESAAKEIATECPQGTMVVSLQNGVDNVHRIKKSAPQSSTVAGMVPYNVTMPAPNRVHRATAGALHLAKSTAALNIAKDFNLSGLTTHLSTDMLSVQWGKLLLNLNNPVNALSDLPLVEQLSNRSYRLVLAALQTEALQVLQKAGIRPAKVSNAPPWILPTILRLPNVLFTRIAASMLKMDTTARSSMWDDLQRGRKTEIDDLCGAVVRLAHAHGTKAPINTAMCQLIASHTKGKRLTGEALQHALSLNT